MNKATKSAMDAGHCDGRGGDYEKPQLQILAVDHEASLLTSGEKARMSVNAEDDYDGKFD